MSDLDLYLKDHYWDAGQLAAHCNITVDELDEFIRLQLVPEPSYVVTDQARVKSFVFGEMAALGATPGAYFHPANKAWVMLALSADYRRDATALQQRFKANFAAALTQLNATTWRLTDSFTDEGEILASGMNTRLDSAWQYFLNGTFGLCVKNPESEFDIAHKEILQEKLVAITENGSKSKFATADMKAVVSLINDYAAASMPFSPVEYPRSSRKRLVDDLRGRLIAIDGNVDD
ncbi:MAG: hypothetical protein KJ930_04995 [Gammaproteobacteria bacterium]|nr:hypothetical protein [Gammaproteobacteria bacterium]